MNDCKKTPISNQFEPHGLQKNIYSAIIPSWIDLHLPFQLLLLPITEQELNTTKLRLNTTKLRGKIHNKK